MIGVSSGLAATGLLLLLLAPDDPDDGADDVAFAIGPTGGAISWRW
jgi:hypothetical protein